MVADGRALLEPRHVHVSVFLVDRVQVRIRPADDHTVTVVRVRVGRERLRPCVDHDLSGDRIGDDRHLHPERAGVEAAVRLAETIDSIE